MLQSERINDFFGQFESVAGYVSFRGCTLVQSMTFGPLAAFGFALEQQQKSSLICNDMITVVSFEGKGPYGPAFCH